MNQRRRLLIVVLAVGIIVVVVLAILNRARDNGPVCERLISAIQAGDVTKSYNMLSSGAQSRTSKDSWQKTTNNLSDLYYNADLKLLNQNTGTNPGTNDEMTTYYYEVKNQVGTYNVTCAVNLQEKVESFSSLVALP